MSVLAPAVSATDGTTFLGEMPVDADSTRHDSGKGPLQIETDPPPKQQDSSPTNISHANALERWNEPRANAYRFAVTLYCFIILGMNDASLGVC
jgi:hypothetical protein